ncbi:MAG: adenylate/guanylate cyclase domain-containing protein [Terrimicrobiaceae bacterium]
MRATLKVKPQGHEPFDMEIGNTATIGRGKDNFLCLNFNPLVSRQHAIIRCHNAFQYQIMDLGSRNGTFVNGRRVITPSPLNHGSLIKITDTEILFELLEDQSADAVYDVTIAAGTDVMGEQSAVTAIMVCDLRGFSTMSEILPEDTLARTLGEWFRDAGNLVQENGGTIDKFIGDAILAYWIQEPSDDSLTASDRALATARQVLAKAAQRTWPQTEKPFRIAIALHYGGVTCGNIGLVAQRDATIIGDAVNTVFRIESVMKPLGQPVVASSDFIESLKAAPGKLVDHGEHQLKGKNQKVRLFGID